MITKNSAKCTACGEEVESTHRHDFNVHYCKVNERFDESGMVIFNFAVDGGRAYRRRVGSPDSYEDTSTFENREVYE